MMDGRNRDLAESVRADDFIISNHLISLIMTQIAENRQLAPVFSELFNSDGSELYLKSAGKFVRTGKQINFCMVVEAARRQNMTAIGYRIQAESKDANASYGIYINPRKSDPITFPPEDQIIVLSEDQV